MLVLGYIVLKQVEKTSLHTRYKPRIYNKPTYIFSITEYSPSINHMVNHHVMENENNHLRVVRTGRRDENFRVLIHINSVGVVSIYCLEKEVFT